MFGCDYNGWQDVPEEEREGMDAFEAGRVAPPAVVTASLVIHDPVLPSHVHLRRAA